MSTPESNPATRAPRCPRLRRVLITLGILAVSYVLIGFLILPPLVRAQAEKRLSKALNRPVSILKVRLNPLTFSIEITGFEVRDTTGGDFIGWNRLSANFDPLKRLLGTWTFKEIELDGLHATILRDASGQLNFADLIEKKTDGPSENPPSSGKRIPAISIGNFAVTHARFRFEDAGAGTPFSTDLGPVTFTLHNFKTAGDTSAPYSFTASSETGESLSWTGTLEPEALRSSGKFALTNLKLPKYSPYYEGMVQFRLRSGDLSIKARYEASLARGSPDVRISDGSLAIQSLELTAPNSTDPRIAVKEIAATELDASLASREVSIGELRFTGGDIVANRQPDGIDILSLMLPKTQASALQPTTASNAGTGTPAPSAAAEAPWSVTVKQIAVAQFDALFTDRTLEHPEKFQVRNLTSRLAPLKIHRLNELSTVELKLGLEGGGNISVEGTAALHPLAGNLAVSLEGIPLSLINPYLQSRMPLHVDKGLFVLAGNVSLAGDVMTFKGNSTIEGFDLRDLATKSPIATWSTLAFEGMEFASHPLKADINHILWRDLHARASISRGGKLNLSSIVGSKPPPQALPAASETTAIAAPPAGPQTLPPLTIGKLTLEQAAFGFQDESVHPTAISEISRLSGTIEGLSSQSLGKGSIQLKGVVNDTAPVEISGQLNPLGSPATADVKLDFKDIELSPMGSYIAKYTGHAFERGALSLAIEFKLNNRTIDSSDVVTLEQFTLGEKNESADALKLPITLAIALLKDSSGQIVIDVPVQGSLDDPNFRIGRVVWRVISNLLAKAATSPFALLGSMFGGGGEELAFQKFEPGATAILETEAGKRATVIKALANRPALKLDLAGGFDPTADRLALQHAKLEEQIRSEFLTAKSAGTNVQASDESPMSQEDRDRAVGRLFAAAFPDLVAPMPSPEPVPTPPSSPAENGNRHSGFIERIRRLFTGSERGSLPPPSTAPVTSESSSHVSPPAEPMHSFSTEEMIARLAEKVVVEENDLLALANARAQNLRGAILQTGEIAPERVFIVSPATTGSRVELKLK